MSIFSFLRNKKPNSPLNVTVYDPEYIKDFVIHWSLTFPIDRWWRERHKIAFNSAAHREVSFLDMRFEFEEFLMNNKIIEESEYRANRSDFLKDNDISLDLRDEDEKSKEFIEEFRDLNLSQFDE